MVCRPDAEPRSTANSSAATPDAMADVGGRASDPTNPRAEHPTSYARSRSALPRSPRDLVVRRRLVDLLDRGLDARLILVCAPAGSGKTTLVSSWASGHGRVVWLSLERPDDELETFVRLLVAACQALVPGVGHATEVLLRSVRPADPARLARQFADELPALTDDVIIVLDDFHAADSPDVQSFVTSFVAAVSDTVHLVIVSRTEPSLPIASLRAHGELVEVRASQLQFTRDEQRAFLQSALGDMPADDMLDAVGEHTEGWAAGLRLATFGWQHYGAEAAREQLRMVSDAALWRDFLIQDVLAAQSPDVQRRLVRAAIPERICASLLQALTTDEDAARERPAPLDALVRANMFLTPLDDGIWYRFHPLFRDAVLWWEQDELGGPEIRALHLRASDWFAGRGLTDDAIQHALWGGDHEHASTLVEEGVHQPLNREDGLESIERWLHLLGPARVDGAPRLLLARAWMLYFADRRGEIPALMQIVHDRLALIGSGTERTVPPELRGQIAFFRGAASTPRGSLLGSPDDGPSQMLAAADEALALLPRHWLHARARAGVQRAMALQLLGRTEEAIAWLEAEHATCPGAELPRLGFLLTALARLYLVTLDLDSAERAAYDMLRIGNEHSLSLTSSWGRVALGIARYERNELDGARAQFEALQPLSPSLPVPIRFDATFGLALTYQALGDDAAASSVLREFARPFEASGAVGLLRLIASMETRLALVRGELTQLEHVAGSLQAVSYPVHLSVLEDPYATQTRALLGLGTSSALQAAEELISRLESSATANHHPSREVRAMLLRALLLRARGDTNAALNLLDCALQRTRAGGSVRAYVDLGMPMRNLLSERAERRPNRDLYLDRLLAAFHSDPVNTVMIGSEGNDMMSGTARHELVEPLTWRELEILELLAERLSNKEIAAKLVISPLTVKRHSMNIYQKLQASGRRDAVSRAASLGLLRSG